MTSSILYLFLNVSLSVHPGLMPVAREMGWEMAPRPRFIIFSGSDWCKNCIQLRQKVLETPEFKMFAKENLEIITADFPQRTHLSKEQISRNEALAEKYNPKGEFPKLVLIGENGTQYKEVVYSNQSPQEFIEDLKSLLPPK
jgi:thiol-disulfide isomerase/thioredoxin